jgi:signal transduction histidine kinase
MTCSCDSKEHKKKMALILDQERARAMLKERELLARELHDGIGQILAAVHLQINSASALIDRQDTAGARSYLERAGHSIQIAKDFIRDYLIGVRDCYSYEKDLFTILSDYIDTYSRDCGIAAELIVPPEIKEEKLDYTMEIQLKSIILEALTNARKHSGASRARVVFAYRNGNLCIHIEDNGCGFNVADLCKKSGFGLRSMKGRAEEIGARLNIHSTPGDGTSLIILIPWQKEEV